MSVPELINAVLNAIRLVFYRDRIREFKRDERALMKAIARYGYECDRRGWNFKPEDIQTELVNLLNSVWKNRAEIKYLPLYLEGAVDRHIRQRADELNAQAKKLSTVTRRAIGNLEVKDVREQTTVEVLATLYKDLKRQKRAKRKPATPTARQEVLL
jgi:hypothetical protein